MGIGGERATRREAIGNADEADAQPRQAHGGLLVSIVGSPSTPATQISAKIGIDIDDGMGDT